MSEMIFPGASGCAPGGLVKGPFFLLRDTHLHFASYALFNAGLDVRSARSLPEMCEHIQKFTRENNDKIIMGFGASTTALQKKRLISKDELDQVCRTGRYSSSNMTSCLHPQQQNDCHAAGQGEKPYGYHEDTGK